MIQKEDYHSNFKYSYIFWYIVFSSMEHDRYLEFRLTIITATSWEQCLDVIHLGASLFRMNAPLQWAMMKKEIEKKKKIKTGNKMRKN